MKKYVVIHPPVALTPKEEKWAAIGVALLSGGRAKAVLGKGRTADEASDDAAKRAKQKLQKSRKKKKRPQTL